MYSITTGVLNPIIGVFTSPINIYRAIDLGFTKDPNRRQQKEDKYNGSRLTKFVMALKPPPCMAEVIKPDGSVDRANVPFHLSVQIMDSLIILAGGSLVA